MAFLDPGNAEKPRWPGNSLMIRTIFLTWNALPTGFIWEGFAMEHVLRFLEARNEDCYYWSTQGGAEIDLVVNTFEGRFGFEFKYGQTPSTTKSMQIAKKELGLKHIYVIHSGTGKKSLGEKITAVGLSEWINHKTHKRRKEEKLG